MMNIRKMNIEKYSLGYLTSYSQNFQLGLYFQLKIRFEALEALHIRSQIHAFGSKTTRDRYVRLSCLWFFPPLHRWWWFSNEGRLLNRIRHKYVLVWENMGSRNGFSLVNTIYWGLILVLVESVIGLLQESVFKWTSVRFRRHLYILFLALRAVLWQLH